MNASILAAGVIFSLAMLQEDAATDKLASFHDDLAGVTISYPASFALKSASEKDAAVARANEKQQASHPDKAISIAPDNIPLLASTAPGTPFAMVQFSRFEGKSINIPSLDVGLRDMATGIMKPFANLMTNPHFGEIAPLDMGDRNGISLFGSGQLNSDKTKTIYVAIVCFSNSGQDACLNEVAFDKTALLRLLHNPIQFDGESAHQLVEKPVDFQDSSSRIAN